MTEQRDGPDERLIRDSKKEAMKWLHFANRASSGFPDHSLEQATEELHHAVQNYWLMLEWPARNSDLEAVRRRWYWPEHGRFPDGAEPVTLFDIGNGPLVGLGSLEPVWQYEVKVENKTPSMLHGEQQEVAYRPFVLEKHQAHDVLRQLNAIAHVLGFGATPDEESPSWEVQVQ